MSEIISLKSKSLLCIVPHFQVFIRDQVAAIKQEFDSVSAVMPMPYFSSLVMRLPAVRKNFRFLQNALDSQHEVKQDFQLLSPKFFTLPIEISRKSSYYRSAKSCIKAVSRNRLRFDLVHAHFMRNGFIGAALKDIYDTPLVVTAHGGDAYDLPFKNSWYNSLTRYILNEADQVITVSQFCAGRLLSLGVSASKLHVIPNGYDEQLFKPLSSNLARKNLGLPLNKRILLSVGNLVDVKGHTHLIDAVNIVMRKRTDLILVLVGSGQLMEKLQRKVKNLGLEGKVLFAGRRTHSEIPLWMNAADIFVLPSLNESFGTVVPEALACGKPVIGTIVGGIPEVLSNQYVRILVNPGDPVNLADAISRALDKRWKPEIIIDYAKQYTWNSIAKKILLLYQTLLA